MAKKLTFSADLPWPVEELFALASSEECIRAKADFLHHEEVEVRDLRNDPSAAGGVVVAYRTATRLPGQAEDAVPPSNHITETVTWEGPKGDGSREYRFNVVVKAVPAEINGKVTMTPLGDSETRNTAVVDVKCRVPMIGWRIEQLIEAHLTQNFDGEIAFIKDWMSTRA